jgi:DNA polymerase III subunit delta
MKSADVRKQIKTGETAPIYLLEGDDLQSRHELAQEFAALVDEGLQAFNLQTFYANEATTASAHDQLIADLLSAARTLPMMSPRRVLIVHEAERLLSPRKSKDDDEDTGSAAAAVEKKRRKALSPSEELEQYFESPEPLTILVFVAGPLDANRRLVKSLRRCAISVDCGALGSSAEAARWVQNRLENDSLTIEPRAITMLLESTGLNLGRLRSEVDKLVLYAAGDQTVTAQHVKDLVLPTEMPADGPAVAMAIKDGNAKRALQEIAALWDAGAPYLPILGQVRWAAGQLRPDERARRALNLVLQTDLAMKTSGGEPRYLLERLVVDLCTRR